MNTEIVAMIGGVAFVGVCWWINRLAAEALGAEIVRGPKGYKLTRDLTAEDMLTARAAVAMARNQAKRMARMANELEAKLNRR